MTLRALLMAAALACVGCDDGGTAEGFPVVPDGECHELARIQCECCGTGQVSCINAVNYEVVTVGAYTALTEDQCATRRAAIEDVQTWCEETFVSPTELFEACQGYPPAPEPADATAGD